MSKEERFVLGFLCYLEFVWGWWLLSGVANGRSFINIISRGEPQTMVALGILMIVGSLIALFLTHKSIAIFIGLVSVPTTFLGLLFLQRVIDDPTIWSNFAIITSVGIFGAIYAGTVFGKVRPPKWTKGSK